MDKREKMEIVSPIGSPRARRSQLAPRRFAGVNGLRIGVLDNNKPNADKFLEFVGAMLRGRAADVELVLKRKMTISTACRRRPAMSLRSRLSTDLAEKSWRTSTAPTRVTSTEMMSNDNPSSQ